MNTDAGASATSTSAGRRCAWSASRSSTCTWASIRRTAGCAWPRRHTDARCFWHGYNARRGGGPPEPDAAGPVTARGTNRAVGHDDALPAGHRLSQYRIRRVLGRGGFGVTYLAVDERGGGQVAVKEYLPAECAVRDADLRVQARSGPGHQADFRLPAPGHQAGQRRDRGRRRADAAGPEPGPTAGRTPRPEAASPPPHAAGCAGKRYEYCRHATSALSDGALLDAGGDAGSDHFAGAP